MIKRIILAVGVALMSSISAYAAPENVSSSDIESVQKFAQAACEDILNHDWRTPYKTFVEVANRYSGFTGQSQYFSTEYKTNREYIKYITSQIPLAKNCVASAPEEIGPSFTVQICLIGQTGYLDNQKHRIIKENLPDKCNPVGFYKVRLSSDKHSWSLDPAFLFPITNK